MTLSVFFHLKIKRFEELFNFAFSKFSQILIILSVANSFSSKKILVDKISPISEEIKRLEKKLKSNILKRKQAISKNG